MLPPWVRTGARLAISLALIGFLAWRYGGDEGFRRSLAQLDVKTALLAEAILAVGLVLSALRWKILLAAADVHLGLLRATRLYFVGYFFNFFLPTTVGGDVMRGAGVGGEVPKSVVGGSIIMERILGFGCLLGLGLVAGFRRPELDEARGVLLVAAAAYVAGLLVLAFLPLPESGREGRLGRIARGLRRTALQVRAYGFRPAALAGAFVASLLWQLALVAANAVLAAGLGGVASARELLTLVPVVQAVSMIPVSFGGLGVREMGYEFFFGEAGLDPAAAVALAAAFLVVTVALALKGGAVYLAGSTRRGPAEVRS